ncbi:pentatricopeptide repeat-containing protein At4g38150-like [Aristolochia californica]|uniref:pentatricopeptide repeat-containing protein At4g38150-like n=1 Tax=Aristolochia californica TaxID=171875 RepID=UPI0035E24C54
MWHFAREILAAEVLDGVHPIAVTWSSLLSEFATADIEECAIHTVDKMLLLGYEPSWDWYNTSTTYNTVHHVASSSRTGAATNVHVRLALGYKSVIISDADMNFRTTKAMGLLPNAIAVLHGLYTDRLIQGALTLFGLISNKCTIPAVVIYMAVVDGCYNALKFEDGQGVFWQMQTIGISSNACSYTVFVHGLCQGQQLKDGIDFGIDMLEAGHSPMVATLIGLVEKRSVDAECVI